jgi:hypothetical protein
VFVRIPTLICPNFSLRYLNLGWTHMSEQCVQYLCRNIQSTIEQLTLSGFRQSMTDECKANGRKAFVCLNVLCLGVENLTRRASRLRILDLSDSSLITDKSVSSVLRNGLHVEHLAFSRCYAIAPIAYAFVFDCNYSYIENV